MYGHNIEIGDVIERVSSSDRKIVKLKVLTRFSKLSNNSDGVGDVLPSLRAFAIDDFNNIYLIDEFNTSWRVKEYIDEIKNKAPKCYSEYLKVIREFKLDALLK